MAVTPLDNPVWYALTGPHAHFATGQGKARHYPRDNSSVFGNRGADTGSIYGSGCRSCRSNRGSALSS
jgi:hypothetical protein